MVCDLRDFPALRGGEGEIASFTDWDDEEAVVADLTCIGIVGIQDPVRPEVSSLSLLLSLLLSLPLSLPLSFPLFLSSLLPLIFSLYRCLAASKGVRMRGSQCVW